MEPQTAPLTLTNAKILELVATLNALDGIRVKGELEPYLFCPEVLWLVADWITLFETDINAYRKAQKSLTTQYKVVEGMPITHQNSEAVAAFMAGLNELNEREVKVCGLQKISRAKLNVGHEKNQNKIPAPLLARLAPILED